MRHTYLLCIFAVFIACQPAPDKNSLALFNGLVFKLAPGERLTEPTKAAVDKYESLIASSGDISIPLFRSIYGQGHIIYIGVPFETDLETIASQLSMNRLLEGGSDETSYRLAFDPLEQNDSTMTFVFEQHGSLAFGVYLDRNPGDGLPITDDELLSRFVAP